MARFVYYSFPVKACRHGIVRYDFLSVNLKSTMRYACFVLCEFNGKRKTFTEIKCFVHSYNLKTNLCSLIEICLKIKTYINYLLKKIISLRRN